MKYLYTVIIAMGLLLSGCGGDDATGPDPEDPTPNVDFTYSPESPAVGEEVSFEGEVNEGSSEITSWQWNFGDDAETTASGQTVTFTYESAGSYDVVLTVTDNNENTADVEQAVTVDDGSGEKFEASTVWSFDTGNSVDTPNNSSTPAIADDGTIYYMENDAGADSRMIAVTDNGDNAQLKWENNLGYRMAQAPAVGPDGGIYIGAWAIEDGFMKISDTGEKLWNFNTGQGVSNSTAAIDGDGNVYLGSKSGNNGGLRSLASDGSVNWEIINEVGSSYASPALSNDGSTVYYFIPPDEALYAINTADGTYKWSEPVALSGGYGTSLSIDSDGTIYITTGSEVAAVTDNGSSGTVKWNQPVGNPNQSGVVIGPEGDLYTGSQDGLIALDPDDGSIIWTYDEIFVEESVPAVDSNGNIYIGSVDGRFSILNPSGELLKEFSLGTSFVNGPVIAEDGTVYVEAKDDDLIKLYKIEVPNSEGPADSPWPMQGKNVKNTSY